jgi:hypothetical protein
MNNHTLGIYYPHKPSLHLELSKDQIPHDKDRAKSAVDPEDLLSHTAPLRRAFELPVSTANILRCVERVLHQLVDVC